MHSDKWQLINDKYSNACTIIQFCDLYVRLVLVSVLDIFIFFARCFRHLIIFSEKTLTARSAHHNTIPSLV